MSNDFNTPSALSHIFGLVGELGKIKNKALLEKKINKHELSAYEFAVNSILKHMRGIFGLFEDLYPEKPVEEVVQKELEAGHVLDEKLIDLLIQVRDMARKERVFKIADYIRDELRNLGIALEDTPTGTKWRKL
ncbi:MAG: DALR domain-containing protein [Hydrogenobacter sp.]